MSTGYVISATCLKSSSSDGAYPVSAGAVKILTLLSVEKTKYFCVELVVMIAMLALSVWKLTLLIEL